MNTEKDLLFTNAISTPMVYYVSYGEKPEEIRMKYGEIQKGTEADLKSFFDAGVVAMKNKNVSAAIGNFMKVVEMVPGFLPAVNNLGALYSSVGQIREAVYFFEEGIKKDPKNFQVRYNLGTLHCLNKNFNEAKGQLLQAKSLFQNEPALNNNLGLTFFGLDKESAESQEIFATLTENNTLRIIRCIVPLKGAQSLPKSNFPDGNLYPSPVFYLRIA